LRISGRRWAKFESHVLFQGYFLLLGNVKSLIKLIKRDQDLNSFVVLSVLEEEVS
jgi:hypothetical protein